MEKIRNRQKENKNRVDQIKYAAMMEKRVKLNDKIENAREKKQEEIRMVRQKAQLDIEAVEDIKLIKKMTVENLRLDVNNKLSETEERRIL